MFDAIMYLVLAWIAGYLIRHAITPFCQGFRDSFMDSVRDGMLKRLNKDDQSR